MKKFATSISCIDGRIQIPINSWIKKNFKVDYVDTITEPGIDRLYKNSKYVNTIKSKVKISVNGHKSKLIVVSGHYNCLANPTSKKTHIMQIKRWMNVIDSWNFDVTVIGIWVDSKFQVITV